jgi:hypothetical protein
MGLLTPPISPTAGLPCLLETCGCALRLGQETIGIYTIQASRRVYPGRGGCKCLLALRASRVLTAKWLIRERIAVNVLPRGPPYRAVPTPRLAEAHEIPPGGRDLLKFISAAGNTSSIL